MSHLVGPRELTGPTEFNVFDFPFLLSQMGDNKVATRYDLTVKLVVIRPGSLNTYRGVVWMVPLISWRMSRQVRVNPAG